MENKILADLCFGGLCFNRQYRQNSLTAKYTSQKNLSLICLFPIDLIQKQPDWFYRNCLLDLNFQINFQRRKKQSSLSFMT